MPRPQKYSVKWVEIERHEGLVDDGDQDGDTWKGTFAEAQALADRLRKNGKRTYTVIPAPKR